jgi:hypothetical protein
MGRGKSVQSVWRFVTGVGFPCAGLQSQSPIRSTASRLQWPLRRKRSALSKSAACASRKLGLAPARLGVVESWTGPGDRWGLECTALPARTKHTGCVVQRAGQPARRSLEPQPPAKPAATLVRYPIYTPIPHAHSRSDLPVYSPHARSRSVLFCKTQNPRICGLQRRQGRCFQRQWWRQRLTSWRC